MLVIDFLKQLTEGINGKQGTENCVHCALRLDEHLAQGKNLYQGPVPKERAGLYTHPLFKAGKIVQSTSEDSRLQERAVPAPEYKTVCIIGDKGARFEIDLTENPASSDEVRFLRAKQDNLTELLTALPRRQKDGTSYGFILLTHQNNTRTGHLINFYVSPDNQVYFIDAQRKSTETRVTQTLSLQGYRSEIFYLQSMPPEGLKPLIKQEKHMLTPAIDSDPDIKKFQEALFATQNNPTAKDYAKLGEFYFKGIGTHKNETQAFKCYQKAVELDKNYAFAWYNLGICFRNGIGTNQDGNQAFKCFEKAVDLDKKSAFAWINLGACFRDGFGTNKNEAQAFKCFEEAHKLDPKKYRKPSSPISSTPTDGGAQLPPAPKASLLLPTPVLTPNFRRADPPLPLPEGPTDQQEKQVLEKLLALRDKEIKKLKSLLIMKDEEIEILKAGQKRKLEDDSSGAAEPEKKKARLS